jgi:hypothetical protein
MSVQVPSNSKELFGKMEMLQGMLGNILAVIAKNSPKINVNFETCSGEIINLDHLYEESTLLDVYRAIPEKHRKKYLKIGDCILDPRVRICKDCDLLRTLKNAFTSFYRFRHSEEYVISCHDGIFEVSYENAFFGTDQVELNPDTYLEDVEEVLHTKVMNLRQKELRELNDPTLSLEIIQKRVSADAPSSFYDYFSRIRVRVSLEGDIEIFSNGSSEFITVDLCSQTYYITCKSESEFKFKGRLLNPFESFLSQGVKNGDRIIKYDRLNQAQSKKSLFIYLFMH